MSPKSELCTSGVIRPEHSNCTQNVSKRTKVRPQIWRYAFHTARLCAISNPKRGRISDPAANAVESTEAEFQRHKGVLRERAFERARLLARKAKAWIIIGMPDNDDDPLTPLAQQIQAMADQSSTDTSALMFG